MRVADLRSLTEAVAVIGSARPRQKNWLENAGSRITFKISKRIEHAAAYCEEERAIASISFDCRRDISRS